MFGRRTESSDKLAKSRSSLLHQLRNINPQRIILHLQDLVERKIFCLKMEAQSGEGLGISIKKLGRAASVDPVELSNPLLTVEQ